KKILHIITILTIMIFVVNYSNIKVSADSQAETPDISITHKKDVKGAFVVTSDPQYPWTDKTDNGQTESESEKKRRSEQLIREQYNSINEYTSQLTGMTEATPVLINGDLTAFGHPWQWDKMESLLGILKSPIFMGLGNHDIENNIDDCLSNSCVRSSMNHYTERMEIYNLTRYDRKGDYPNNSHKFGSFAYSIDLGPIHFVQLNNYPTMTFMISEYTMEDSLNWLEQDLKEANQYGQAIIVNMHEPSGWKKGTQEQKNRFENLLKTYNVKAVFAGHYHKKNGYFPNDYKEYFGDVPVFLSGSASQKTYLTAEYNNNEIKVYKVNNNDWRNKTLVRTIDISGRNFPSYEKKPEFYEHSNGLGKNFDTDNIPHSEWNDKISSVRVPPHVTVELYEHSDKSGRKQVLTNTGDLPKLYNLYDFNDITSAFRWYKI
ncbi:metallophosphoesterase, partial [Bacillus pseudomycoides]|uniref:metallophosphoesterase n=1 Tax=Bacillus pseudomycoides TaxID=64104 RepID=UPI002E1E594A|nr:metallophosphoesterase [Bacillus pseudomycoides]